MSERLEEIKEKTRRWYSAYECKVEDFEWLIAEVERLQNAIGEHTIRCDRIISESKAEVERLRTLQADKWRMEGERHQTPCTYGPLCPYCEIERLRKRCEEARPYLRRLADYVDLAGVKKCLEGKP